MSRSSRTRTAAIVTFATCALLGAGGAVAAFADEKPTLTLSSECRDGSEGVSFVTPAVAGDADGFITWEYSDIVGDGDLVVYQKGSFPIDSIPTLEITIRGNPDSGSTPALVVANLRSWDDPHGSLASAAITPNPCI